MHLCASKFDPNANAAEIKYKIQTFSSVSDCERLDAIHHLVGSHQFFFRPLV